MAERPPVCNLGWKAKPFSLPATDGKTYTLDDVRGERGTLVMFICNHCPYVKSIIDRIVRDAAALQKAGIGVAAICANDADTYPDDSFDKMGAFAETHVFTFPYLHDESQDVARAWDAICTPDFFGFDADLGLQYRGRLDESGREAAPPNARRELYDAMMQIAETGKGPDEQTPSIGCSIKWKAA